MHKIQSKTTPVTRRKTLQEAGTTWARGTRQGLTEDLWGLTPDGQRYQPHHSYVPKVPIPLASILILHDTENLQSQIVSHWKSPPPRPAQHTHIQIWYLKEFGTWTKTKMKKEMGEIRYFWKGFFFPIIYGIWLALVNAKVLDKKWEIL